MLTADRIKAQARQVGFDLCGVAPAAAFPELGRLRAWLERGYGGEMAYLRRTADARADVRHVLPSARSILVTATVYNVDRPYSIERADPARASIARYAWGDDYHGVLADRLHALLRWMQAGAPAPFDARAYVDTGPIQERVFARHAGLGWIGKNGCLINPALGSWLLLAEIVTSLDLVPDEPALDRCGTCTLCLEACPTGALVEPGLLDATRCLAYLTIELKGPIPVHHRERVANRVFGCDICQEVCPWNQGPARTERPEWQPRAALDAPGLIEMWQRSDPELAAGIRGSAVARTRVRGLRRNLAVALGNSGEAAALAALDAEPAPASPSRLDPMVVDHVAWARKRILGAEERDRARAGQPGTGSRLVAPVAGSSRGTGMMEEPQACDGSDDMLISKELNAAINEEIGLELFASNQYLNIAAYFDSLALRKLAKMFYKQSDEERDHALKFVHYITETGGTLQIPQVEAPKAKFSSIEEAVKLSLDWEIEVTRRCAALMTLAIEQKDYAAQDFLRWFQTEQVEEVNTMETLLQVARTSGDRNLYMLEAYLSHD